MRNFFVFFFFCLLGLAIAAQSQGSDGALYKPVGKCPSVDGDIPEYLADDEDPTVFYQCRLGLAYWKKCPENTIFDKNVKVCVHKNRDV